MANDAPTKEVIPESSAGIMEALVVVRVGEAGLAQQDGHARDDGERGGDEGGRFDGPARADR
jgi:hypothetical protein